MSTHIINFPGADIHTTTITSVSNVSVGENLDVHGTANVAALTATLPYSTASANIVAWNSSTNEVIDSGIERGFTEHPVEPMTDYTTYVEGHGTYEASVSSEQSGTAWKMFDYVSTGGVGASGLVWSDLYSADGTYQGSKHTADVGGTRYTGEWIQLKMPYAILLSHFKWFPVQNWEYRSPAKGLVLGSNDGENWYKLTSWSGQTFTFSTGSEVRVNAATAYQYFRLVVENTGTSSDFTQWRASAMEWRLFAEKPVTRMENVHISGDLSSETLQTGYIKWPRVPLKANESEGYVASASSTTNVTYHDAWRAFNGTTKGPNGDAWITPDYTFLNATGLPDSANCVTFDNVLCEWIQITSPTNFALSHLKFFTREEVTSGSYFLHAPRKGRIYGSNDGITYTKLQSYDNLSYSGGRSSSRVDVSSNNEYSTYKITVDQLMGNGIRVDLGELQLFEAATGVGAAPTSAKLQVHGSLGLAKGSSLYAGDSVVAEFPKHDRPLTRYPEFGLTGNSDRGYVVSRSSINSGNWEGYKAFNRARGTTLDWHSISNIYSNGAYIGGAKITDVDGTDYDGEWIKLQMPMAIRLKNFSIMDRDGGSGYTNRLPKDGTLLGSNDGSEWHVILRWTNRTFVTDVDNWFEVNSSRYYSRFGLVAEALANDTGASTVNIGEIKYYGYEEGDESVDVVHRSVPNKPGTQHLDVYWDANDSNSYSFADSSNVYDLSGNGRTGTMTGGVGFDAEYNAFTFDGGNITGDSNSTAGNWIHTMSTWIYFNSLVTNEVFRVTPNSFVYGGHNEVSAFFARSSGFIWDFGMQNNNTTTLKPVTNRWYHVTLVADGSGYKKIYIDNELQTSFSYSNNTNIVMQTNAPLAIGVGNLDGSISNFRLYSKALNADQVRELYEYDAERFGYRQNLVALHKGNLGVGVAHPTARFEVAGADGLQEFPPKAMTGYETYMEGHGVFRAIGDRERDIYRAWMAFDKLQNTFWDNITDLNGNQADQYQESSGDYIGSATTYADGGHIDGGWIQLQIPYKVKLSSFAIAPQPSSSGNFYGGSRMPKTGSLVGSNDGQNWYLIGTIAKNVYEEKLTHFSMNSTSFYSYFRLIAQTITAGDNSTWRNRFCLSEFKLFGTPAPSALEDGHLTLGKALTLPRVSGHAAGAETPRADSLVVHYDTTVDSVVSGDTVVDISGSGNNGTLTNEAAYSSTDRALTFDGVDDYIKGNIPSSLSGNDPYSFSMWLKPNAIQVGYIAAFEMGNRTTNQSCGLYFNGGLIVHLAFGNNLQATTSIVVNQWIHIVGTYTSGSRKIYADGVLVTSDTYSSLNIGATEMTLGANNDDGQLFNGSISKFKLYDIALTAEEVAAEYALGRTGKSLNLTDTSLCLGGTVPRAQLDVRGGAVVDGHVGIGTADPGALLELSSDTGSSTIVPTKMRISSTSSASDWSTTDDWGMVSFYSTDGSGAGPADVVSIGARAVGTVGGTAALTFRTKSGDAYPLAERMCILDDGKVGIGKTDPFCKLHIASDNNSASGSNRRAYFFPTSTGALSYDTGTGSGVSVWSDGWIGSFAGFIAANATTFSDERLKKNIIDADDGECLDTLRQLKPKKYQYKDYVKRGETPVWGFIAQEVEQILPYSTHRFKEFIPNIYELANVSASNVITFTNFNTSNLESNATIIRIMTKDDNEETVTIAEVIDEHAIRVEEDLSEWTGSLDETGNVVAGNQLFIYGQQVEDVRGLKKDAIWTVATSALQEVDRQLQAEKAKVASLEARIAALENP